MPPEIVEKTGMRVVGTKRLAWGKLNNRKLQVNMFNGQAVCDGIYFGANLGDSAFFG